MRLLKGALGSIKVSDIHALPAHLVREGRRSDIGRWSFKEVVYG
jgi:hypothetical protein